MKARLKECGCPPGWCYMKPGCPRRRRVERPLGRLKAAERRAALTAEAARLARRLELLEGREDLLWILAQPAPKTPLQKRRREAQKRALGYVEAALERQGVCLD